MKNKDKDNSTKKDWHFCNAKLEPYPHPWSHGKYKCPRCGSTSGMVNILGGCNTKIFIK